MACPPVLRALHELYHEGGWLLRWIGCAAVWEAGRAVCGERHLRQTQGYALTATEDDGVGRGAIHTHAIA